MVPKSNVYHVGRLTILVAFLTNVRLALSFTTIPKSRSHHSCLVPVEHSDNIISNVPWERKNTKSRRMRISFLYMSENQQQTPEDDEESGLLPKEENEEKKEDLGSLVRRGLIASSGIAALQLLVSNTYAPSGFKRIPTQFIAALGDPNASSGTEAKQWGLWRLDPGPRGVWLRDYKNNGALGEQSGGIAPAGWKFDVHDWWLEEHGLIMEAPDFPLEPGRYLVTGGRMVTTGLTIDSNGGWKLDNGKLYDVTHLPCRSARYNPNIGGGSPLTAKTSDFPVAPGAEMPSVEGCDKQDYAVLFVIGVEDF